MTTILPKANLNFSALSAPLTLPTLTLKATPLLTPSSIIYARQGPTIVEKVEVKEEIPELSKAYVPNFNEVVLTKSDVANTYETVKQYFAVDYKEWEKFLLSLSPTKSELKKELTAFLSKVEKKSLEVTPSEQEVKKLLSNRKINNVLLLGANTSFANALATELKLDKGQVLEYNDKVAYKDKSVDLIVMLDMYRHVQDVNSFMTKMLKILTDDGIIIIREEDAPKDPSERNHYTYIETLLNYIGNAPEYLRLLTAYELQNDMRHFGLYPLISADNLHIARYRQIKLPRRTYYNAYSRKNPIYKTTQLLQSATSLDKDDETAWLNKLEVVLKNILQRYKLSEKQYLTNNTMPVWIKAFTSEERDNISNNGDLKFLGTELLMANSSVYITDSFPQLDESDYTEIRNILIGVASLRKYANHLDILGLTRMTNYNAIIKDSKDLELVRSEEIQSLIATLYILSVDDTQGAEVVSTILTDLFKTQTVDDTWYRLNANTQIAQLFSTLGSGIRFETREMEGYTEVSLPLEGKELLERYIKPRLSIYPSIGRSNMKSQAKRLANEDMFRQLNNYGINLNWAKNIAAVEMLKRFPSGNSIPLRYTSIRVEESSKYKVDYFGVTYRMMQLIGTNNGKADILRTVVYEDDEQGFNKKAAHAELFKVKA